MRKYLILFILVASVFHIASSQQLDEKYRPAYHFSPAKGWIGDPDGLVFHNGLFHLYWWGHATSPDLVNWTEHPWAMHGDDKSFVYFSGSVVVDKNDTGGFGHDAMVAFYTMHVPGDSIPEKQGISVSNDAGISFHYYNGNPVLDIDKIFFRDPQVFWHEADGQWKMIVSRPDEELLNIYESDNLVDWKYCSVFGGLGAVGEFWECPDLFEMTVPGTDIKKWVVLIGRGPNRVQYFIGEFDGNTFTPDREIADYLKQDITLAEGVPDHALWLDYGNDYYATRTWRSYDNDRNFADTVYAIGWMGNWDYARETPMRFQSVPRAMFLKQTDNGLRIVQQPVPQLRSLRRDTHTATIGKVEGEIPLDGFRPEVNSYELEIEFEAGSADSFGVKLLKGDSRELVISYDPAECLISLDRTNCSDFSTGKDFDTKFPAVMKAPLELLNGKLRLHIFVDTASVEVFTNDGEIVLSATTYPSPDQTGIQLFSTGGATEITSLTAWNLAPVIQSTINDQTK